MAFPASMGFRRESSLSTIPDPHRRKRRTVTSRCPSAAFGPSADDHIGVHALYGWSTIVCGQPLDVLLFCGMLLPGAVLAEADEPLMV